ncbi:hypothetical protein GCM10018785_58530 [Streptomyces longispororuber]|uniref:Uncharacterized protein n=1 Tax=Streptomyces longispororuber TaxID=68230 RepID=A0A919DVB9_9ACTN|nr:hypothetical protein GCM10018785_58530 [Streptomyces longispororuber]
MPARGHSDSQAERLLADAPAPDSLAAGAVNQHADPPTDLVAFASSGFGPRGPGRGCVPGAAGAGRGVSGC